MNIFDVFSFKKSFSEVFSKENFASLFDLAKEQIIAKVKEEYPGQQKMDEVVEKLMEFIDKHMTSKNGIVIWVVENILKPNVRAIAQEIYCNLKRIVEGL